MFLMSVSLIKTLDRILVLLNGGYAVEYENTSFVNNVFEPIRLAALPCAVILCLLSCMRATSLRERVLSGLAYGLILIYFAVSVALMASLYVPIMLGFSPHIPEVAAIRARDNYCCWMSEVLTTWAVLVLLMGLVKIGYWIWFGVKTSRGAGVKSRRSPGEPGSSPDNGQK